MHTTHNLSRTSLYARWRNMRTRCDDPKSISYPQYGAKGISYCPEWRTFDGFLADMQEGYEPHLHLGRLDHTADYSKSNCRWMTRKETNQGKKRNK